MSEKPRRWFQIHLSTAIVLMFVAGGLMWANIRTRVTSIEYWDEIYGTDSLEPPDRNVVLMGRGWPLPFQRWHHNKVTTMPQPAPSFVALGFNVLANFVILLCVAEFFESYIRRREARKP